MTIVINYFSEPNHQRAASNRKYYEQQIAENEALRFKRGDDGSEKQYEPQDEEIKNERNPDSYKSSLEFSNYEAMCRGETVFVSLINGYKCVLIV